VDILLPIIIKQYISIIASILKPLVSNRLLYDEYIKVTGRLDFHVKMGLALFYQLKRSIDLGIIEEGDVLPPSR
jgi:hypothetical protein